MKISLLVFLQSGRRSTDYEMRFSRHCSKGLLCVRLFCKLCTNWAYALLFSFYFLGVGSLKTLLSLYFNCCGTLAKKNLDNLLNKAKTNKQNLNNEKNIEQTKLSKNYQLQEKWAERSN